MTNSKTETQPSYGLMIAWIYWFICASFYFYQFILRVVPNLAGSSLAQDFSLTASSLGEVGFAWYVGYSLFQIPSGLLIDKFGPKKMMMIGILLCAINTYIFAQTENFWLIKYVWVFNGIGSAFAFICCAKIAAVLFPSRLMSLVLSLTVCLGSISGTFSNYVIKSIIDDYSWRTVMEILAYSGVGILLLSFFVKTKTNTEESTSYSVLKEVKHLLQNSQVMLVTLFAFCIYLPLSMIGDSWGSEFLVNVYGKEFSKDASFLYIGMIFGSILYGVLSARIDHVKGLLVSITIPQLVCSVLLVWAPNFVGCAVASILFIIGFFNGGQMLMYTLAALNAPKKLGGTVSSIINMGTMVSGAIFIKLFGVLLDSLWEAPAEFVDGARRVYEPISYQYAMSVVPLAMAVALCTLLFIKHKKTH